MKNLDTIKNLFTPGQLSALETWLLDERMAVAETQVRVKKELGVEVSLDNLWYYFRRRARQRQAGELILAQITANDLNGLPVRVDDLRAAALKLVGTAALKFASERPDNVRELESLTRLLLISEDNDLKRRRLSLEERAYRGELEMVAHLQVARIRAYLADLEADADLTHDQKLDLIYKLLFDGKKCPRPDLVEVPTPADNAASPETPAPVSD